MALGYFKWRAQPADAKDPIPADVEMQKKAEEAAPAAIDPETAKFAQIGKAFASLMAACGGANIKDFKVPNDLNDTKDIKDTTDTKGTKDTKDLKDTKAAEGTPVLAPLNGTFYRSAGPGKPELAKDGVAVKSGDAVCIVEAMKLFNPIKATAAGTITFLVEHGKPVTKGQTLAVIA